MRGPAPIGYSVRALTFVLVTGVGFALFGCDHTQRSPQTIHDGFEGTSLSKLWRTDKLAKNALELQSEHVRAGQSAVKITIRSGDPSPSISADETERDELQESDEFNAKEGECYSYEFTLFVPKDFPVVSTRLVFAQWKQKEGTTAVKVGNPIIALRYVSGALSITIQTDNHQTTHYITQNEIRGRWLDFVFHIRHARTPDGAVRVWMNGEEILNFQGPTAYSEKFGYEPYGVFYFKMGLYRDDMAEPMSVYFDEYRKRPLTRGEFPELPH